MKKIILTLALVITMVCGVSAQDGFFRGGEGDYSGSRTISGTLPGLPQQGIGATNNDQAAPVGSGLIILTALGAGYAVSRKNTRRGE